MEERFKTRKTDSNTRKMVGSEFNPCHRAELFVLPEMKTYKCSTGLFPLDLILEYSRTNSFNGNNTCTTVNHH